MKNFKTAIFLAQIVIFKTRLDWIKMKTHDVIAAQNALDCALTQHDVEEKECLLKSFEMLFQ